MISARPDGTRAIEALLLFEENAGGISSCRRGREPRGKARQSALLLLLLRLLLLRAKTLAGIRLGDIAMKYSK